MKDTRQLTYEQKTTIFDKHCNLISLIHGFGDMMLRKQIKALYQIMYGVSPMKIDLAINELIEYGFLVNKRITNSKTKMLYLSKFPRFFFYPNLTRSGDVPALNFTKQKIYEQIFKIDYLLDTLIPQLKKEHKPINFETIGDFLVTHSNTMFYKSNQLVMPEVYNMIAYNLEQQGHILSYEYNRDECIAIHDKQVLELRHQKNNPPIPTSKEKEERDDEMSLFQNVLDKNKYYYNIGQFHNHRLFVENMDENTISVVYFDSLNKVDVKFIYSQLAFTLLMFQRYTNNKDIKIEATIYLWNEDRKNELINKENTKAFDFKTQEHLEESNKEHILQGIGILPSNWDYIHATYEVDNLEKRYYL
jgi:hypothetical protein